jgi:hypothetical protein
VRGVTVTVDTTQRPFFLSGILKRRSTTSDAEKYSQSEYFVSKQKEQHITLQNILILNILSVQKDQQMMLQNIQDFVHIDDGLVVFLFLIALVYTVGCHVTITNFHQKQHYVPYYLSIVFFLSLKYAFGIISMFFTLVRCSIIFPMLFLTYLHPFFLPYVQIYRISIRLLMSQEKCPIWQVLFIIKFGTFAFFLYCTVLSRSS